MVLTAVVSNGVCDDTETKTVNVKPNLLSGQIKYYNAQESPMPSPFNTNYNGMTVPDYFYAELFEAEISKGLVKVEPYFSEDGDEVLSYFAFTHNIDPTKNIWVKVYDGDYTYTDGTLADGYLGQNWTWNHWGGVNGTDGLLIQQMAAGVPLNAAPYNKTWLGLHSATPAYGFFANGLANVNNSVSSITGDPTLTALDVLLTNRRAVGLLNQFPNNKPNFEVAGKLVSGLNTSIFGTSLPNIDFEPEGTTYIWSELAEDHTFKGILGELSTGNKYLNVYYSAVGDLNASYQPGYGGFKNLPDLILEDGLTAAKGEIVTLPVYTDRTTDLGALSLGLKYRKDLVEVLTLNYSEDFARIDAQKGEVQIAWSSLDGIRFSPEQPLAVLTIRVIGDIEPGTSLFELTDFTEMADVNAEVLGDVALKTLAITTDAGAGRLVASNFPNPFGEATTLSYYLPESGMVNLTIYNALGQVVASLVSENQSSGTHERTLSSLELPSPGHYYYKLELQGETKTWSFQNNLIHMK